MKRGDDRLRVGSRFDAEPFGHALLEVGADASGASPSLRTVPPICRAMSSTFAVFFAAFGAVERIAYGLCLSFCFLVAIYASPSFSRMLRGCGRPPGRRRGINDHDRARATGRPRPTVRALSARTRRCRRLRLDGRPPGHGDCMSQGDARWYKDAPSTSCQCDLPTGGDGTRNPPPRRRRRRRSAVVMPTSMSACESSSRLLTTRSPRSDRSVDRTRPDRRLRPRARPGRARTP